jgi:hypothetical protein
MFDTMTLLDIPSVQGAQFNTAQEVIEQQS